MTYGSLFSLSNFENLIGNASQAMTTRFWFFSRVIVLAFKSFDFIKKSLERQPVSRTMPGSAISTPTEASLADPNANHKASHDVCTMAESMFESCLQMLEHPSVTCVLFKALGDVLKGLYNLYIEHYVHRDISAGNIIFCNEMGKISVEYPKKNFHLVVLRVSQKYVNYNKDPPIYMVNGLHFPSLTVTIARDQLDPRDEQRELFNDLFPHRLEGSYERCSFFVDAQFLDATEKAHPNECIDVVRQLLRIRSVLTYRYNEVENLRDFLCTNILTSISQSSLPVACSPRKPLRRPHTLTRPNRSYYVTHFASSDDDELLSPESLATMKKSRRMAFQGATEERKHEGESRWQQPLYLQAGICGGYSERREKKTRIKFSVAVEIVSDRPVLVTREHLSTRVTRKVYIFNWKKSRMCMVLYPPQLKIGMGVRLSAIWLVTVHPTSRIIRTSKPFHPDPAESLLVFHIHTNGFVGTSTVVFFVHRKAFLDIHKQGDIGWDAWARPALCHSLSSGIDGLDHDDNRDHQDGLCIRRETFLFDLNP
ncbi:hypothetical protein IW261DRAFT_1591217 [Armillaria novae-zelandiae]|uniref:Fungal-type protein kinase domain-containing protein n=1 Tax=Armillaria novae-zelandiae TaxID=153914 RepID=A0AA39PKK5_9AGAR|nr:hypothetical protein IW261DRAFT_1591217 [Armillaria novae-zelandiae]